MTLLTFVGYSAESKAYRILDKATNKVTICRDITNLKKKRLEKIDTKGRKETCEIIATIYQHMGNRRTVRK